MKKIAKKKKKGQKNCKETNEETAIQKLKEAEEQQEYTPEEQSQKQIPFQEQEEQLKNYDETQTIQDTLPEELTTQTSQEEEEEEKSHKNQYHKKHSQETISIPSLESIQKTLDTHTKTFKEAISNSLTILSLSFNPKNFLSL